MPHARAVATIGTTKLVITHVDGEFGSLPGVSRYAGGPLAEGRPDSVYIVCPWYCWTYHSRASRSERSVEADALPRYDMETETGRIVSSDAPPSKRVRDNGRVLGISITSVDQVNPRSSTSDALLGDYVAKDWTSARSAIASLHMRGECHVITNNGNNANRMKCPACKSVPLLCRGCTKRCTGV